MSEFEMVPTARRGFLARLAAGSLAVAAGGYAKAFAEAPAQAPAGGEWDTSWMAKIKGKHRQLFDGMTVNSGFGPVMARIWLMTSAAYGAKENELSAVLVVRHEAICIAMNDSIWSKYKPAERNIFAMKDTYWAPPFAAAAIDQLKASGVIMCACNMALMHYAEQTGGKVGIAKDAAIAEWKANLLPGMTLVPSGVLAVNRAQEHACTYCNVS